jgi:hypothetical protein
LKRARRSGSAGSRGCSGQRGLERFEAVDRRISIGLGRFVTGSIGSISRGKKLEKCVRVIEADDFCLARGANELLPGERGIADQRLQRCFSASPEVDDVGGEIFCGARSVEMSQNRARAV